MATSYNNVLKNNGNRDKKNTKKCFTVSYKQLGICLDPQHGHFATIASNLYQEVIVVVVVVFFGLLWSSLVFFGWMISGHSIWNWLQSKLVSESRDIFADFCGLYFLFLFLFLFVCVCVYLTYYTRLLSNSYSRPAKTSNCGTSISKTGIGEGEGEEGGEEREGGINISDKVHSTIFLLLSLSFFLSSYSFHIHTAPLPNFCSTDPPFSQLSLIWINIKKKKERIKKKKHFQA